MTTTQLIAFVVAPLALLALGYRCRSYAEGSRSASLDDA